jgi:hypothetical protein
MQRTRHGWNRASPLIPVFYRQGGGGASMTRVRADFNGLFGEILCLSHTDKCVEQNGVEVPLAPGMVLTAFDEDTDESGKRNDIMATGVVEPSPEWLACRGSRWVLRIDARGVRHQSEIERAVEQ